MVAKKCGGKSWRVRLKATAHGHLDPEHSTDVVAAFATATLVTGMSRVSRRAMSGTDVC